MQDDLEKFLRAEIADREESIAELQHILDALDIKIGNALEAIGEFPPKPAAMPDRVDVICRLMVEYYVEIQRMKEDDPMGIEIQFSAKCDGCESRFSFDGDDHATWSSSLPYVVAMMQENGWTLERGSVFCAACAVDAKKEQENG